MLKPTGDDVTPMAVGGRRPNNIFYARVRSLVSFDILNPDGSPLCQVECEFFVKRPQSSMAIIHLNNVAANLSSYLGHANLPAITADVCRHDIFNVTYWRHPWDLKEPHFNRPNATIDMSVLDLRFKDHVLTFGWPFLKASLYRATCPGNIASPSATLESISQVNVDSLENETTRSV